MTKAKYKDEESLRKAKEKLPDLEFRRMKNGEVVVAKKRKAETGKIKTDKTNQIIIYNTENGETKIEARMKDENVSKIITFNPAINPSFCHSARNPFDFTILRDSYPRNNIPFKGSLRDDKLMVCCA